MLLSQILAWAAALLCIEEALRYIARVSKNKTLNRVFHKLHIPLGVLLLIAGGLHGLIAGNFPGAGLAEIELAPVLFTLNWGTACFICSVLLALSYLLRKKLKKGWMPVHRVLTVLMLALLVLHVAEVGIHLPDRWAAPAVESSPQVSPAPPEPTAAPPAFTPAPKPTAAASPAPTETPAPTGEPSPTPAPTEPPEEEPGLADGVYTGSAPGYRSDITVSVTVSAGKITDIEITDENETPRYFAGAMEVIDYIISAQSTQVDAVTGATFSSEGIKAAVEDALRAAQS